METDHLDRRLADLLTGRRLVPWAEIVRLRAEATKLGEARLGSPLAAALVRTGKLPAAEVDALLLAAVSTSGESSRPPAADAWSANLSRPSVVASGVFFPAAPTAPTAPPGAPGASSAGEFFPRAADPERTVLDLGMPIALPPPPEPSGRHDGETLPATRLVAPSSPPSSVSGIQRPPAGATGTGARPVKLGPPADASSSAVSGIQRPHAGATGTGARKPTKLDPSATTAGALDLSWTSTSKSVDASSAADLMRFAKSPPARAPEGDSDRTVAAPPSRPAARSADSDRTMAARAVDSDRMAAQAADSDRTIAAPLDARPAATPAEDGSSDRTLAAPMPGEGSGFGSSPAGFGSSPAGFGSSPAGFGSSPAGSGAGPSGPGAVPSSLSSGPAGFGAAPSGFGSSPAGFGAGPGGFGSGPGTPWKPDPDRTALAPEGSTRGGPASGNDATRAAPVDGKTVAPAAERLAAVFAGGRFERQEALGGDRFRALDRRIRRPVILAIGPATTAGGATPQDPFFREARLLAAIEHPAVPRIFDAGVEGARTFVAFELPEGERLADAIRPRAAPALPALLRAFLEVTGAVARAHEAGVLHGSLGYQRVVLGSLGRVSVDGWAWARALPKAPPEVQEAAALAPPPEEDEVPRRPGEAGKDKADPRTDVFGLGLVLERILDGRHAGAPAAPSALRAIVAKALKTVSAQRYPSVRALQEDVRRYIDGRSVSAEGEGLIGAALRLGRKHPEVAGVLGTLAVVLLVVGGVFGLRLSKKQALRADAERLVVEAAARRTTALEDGARIGRETKEVLALVGGLSRLQDRLDAARADLSDHRIKAELQGGDLNRAIAVTAAGDELVDRDLVAAAEAVHDAEKAAQAVVETAAPRAVDQAVDPTVREAAFTVLTAVRTVQGELPEALATARLARGAFWLQQAGRTRPDKALAEYRALAVEPDLPEDQRAAALLGQLLAARRLAGEGALLREAQDGLDKLGAYDRITDYLKFVTDLESRGVEDDPGVAQKVSSLKKILERRRDLALGHELLGRLRGVDGGGRNHDAVAEPVISSLLDPSDPIPFFRAVRANNHNSGVFPIWRWLAGFSMSGILRGSSRVGLDDACALDPAPVLYVADYLDSYQRSPTTLDLLEPVVRTLDALERLRPETRAEVHPSLVRARLLLARARLANGKDPGDLEALEVPPGLDHQCHALRFWAALRAGRAPDALSALQAAFQTMRQNAEAQQALFDILHALVDPDVSPQTVLAVVDPVLSRGGPPDLHAARARALSFLGRDPGPDYQQYRPCGREYDLLAALATARSVARNAPQQIDAHRVALLLWSQVDLMNEPTEQSAYEAQEIVVGRLRALGRTELADAFDQLDAVGELWTGRAFLPPEVNAWKKRR